MTHYNEDDNQSYAYATMDDSSNFPAMDLKAQLWADRGRNTLSRRVPTNYVNKWGETVYRTKRVDVYTSGGAGTFILDAETGDQMPHRVGSMDEDLYFKVAISTGECTSVNKSNIAFFHSPSHYARYTYSDVHPDVEEGWRLKREARLQEIARQRAVANNGSVSVR